MIFIKILEKTLKLDYLWIRKNEKVIRLMKNELGWKIMKEFVGIRAKTYSS